MDSCPLSKTSDLLVLDLINEKNDSAIERDQIDYGLPVAYAPEDPDAELNTQLDVFAEPTSPWNNKVNVKYQRLDLGRLFGEGHIVTLQEGANNADLICAINTTFGTQLTELEFDIAPALGGAELPEEVTVKAREIGLGYTGEVKFALELGRMHLNTRLTGPELNGFGYPNADTPSLNNVILKVGVPGGELAQNANGIGGAGDDRLGYDTFANGEVMGYVRLCNTAGSWDSENGRGVLPDANGVRTLRTSFSSHSNFGFARTWYMNVGFKLVDGSRYQTITDGYNIVLKVRTRANAQAAWTTRDFFVRANPANPAQHQLVDSTTLAVASTFGNIGAGAATQKFIQVNGTVESMYPGLTKYTQNVNGSTLTRLWGLMEVELVLTRKAGRAKVITVLSKANPING